MTRTLWKYLDLAIVLVALAATVQTSAQAQTPYELGQPEAYETALTNDVYELVLTNSTSGKVPVATTVQNVDGGPITVTHTSTNNPVGYYLQAGQAITFTEPQRVSAPFYGKLASTTNATVRTVREYKK